MSFLTEYFDIVGDKTEVAVCCPFTHYTETGLPYYENNPSAHVNTVDNLFHCKVCGASGNELTMIQKLLDCNANTAKKLQRCFASEETIIEWEKESLTQASFDKAIQLGISEQIIKELHIKTPEFTENIIAFPVLMYDHLLDIRQYNPGGNPKVKSRLNCPTGLIIPFNEWIKTPVERITLICAGEKDMAIARTHGFNAITITGGESALPCQNTYFKDRHIAIVYDNDDTGKKGAYKLAKHLQKYTDHIKVVTNFHECLGHKEDITDFFTKYHKTKEDLINYIEATEWYDGPKEIVKNYPIMDLLTASSPKYTGKMVKSNVQIVAISETTFSCPTHIFAEKIKPPKEGDMMQEGEFREWILEEENVQDILHMIDNNFKEETIKRNYRDILHILQKESYISLNVLKHTTVFKCYLTDMYETNDAKTTQPIEYTAYAIEQKLESGQKYMITYKLVPHPYKGQQLIMLIMNAEQANDSVTNFELTPEVKKSLKTIQEIPGELQDKINCLTEKVKGLLGYNGINTLIQAIDFAYNTPLQFNFGNFKNIRAYLDTIIVGESRTGKSSTADCLRQLYELGTFTSLAGNSATIPGLVGGSNKTPTGYQTRAGIIPQNHRGLIIFEEFGKSNNSVITELTDIRSSNEVRITRVAGTIALPAMVRMITLTNPKNKNGSIQSIASYPNGISVLTDLVETAEDIARYDMIVILPDKGNAQIDPLWIPEEPFPKQIYKDKIRWVWSREPEQIIIDRETQLYIVEVANRLNKTYEGHIKIFGTEAWKKISRLAIAIAGYVCSTDETYENIIVKKEHIDFAEKFLVNLYDNPTFKLKEFINYEKQYSTIDEEGVAALQNLYDKSPQLILQLEQCSTTNRKILTAVTGMNSDDLNKTLNALTKTLFIKYNNHEIIPTERFRMGLSKIERKTYVPKVGEINVEIPMGEVNNFYL
jgi:DNA primase